MKIYPTSTWFFVTFLVWVGMVRFSLFAGPTVCSRVRLQIEQELTLEREAFEAKMTIQNGLIGMDLENIEVTLHFLNDQHVSVPVTENVSNHDNTGYKFFYRLANGSSMPTRIAAGERSEIRWLMIPTVGAGGTNPMGQIYYIGATLRYTAGGSSENIDVVPDDIRVHPMPLLVLDYFLPKNVEGDDPLTAMIEPTVPFSLGLRIKNTGHGPAKKLKMDSAQPRILDSNGLAVSFSLEGCEVNGRTAEKVLQADFGDLSAGQSGVARWLMTSSLKGRFTKFDVHFKHADEYGGEVTSLIEPEGVRTHFLVRDVLVDVSGSDSIRDFLAYESEASNQLKLYGSEGEDENVQRLYVQSLSPQGDQVYFLKTDTFTGPGYIEMTNPTAGKLRLVSVVRADGKVLNEANVWTTATRNPTTQELAHFLHLFDIRNEQGLFYQFNFEPFSQENRPPILASIPDKIIRPGESLSLLVEASDPDQQPLTLETGPLPKGAQFSVLSNGRGKLTWKTAVDDSQLGNYTVGFTVSDGLLTNHKTVKISVSKKARFDAFLAPYFGETSPTIAPQPLLPEGGSVDPQCPLGDADEDGLTNLVEYGLGLNPLRPDVEGVPTLGTTKVEGKTYLTLTYLKRTDDPALVFKVIASGQLTQKETDWEVLTDSLSGDQEGVPSGMERRETRDRVAIEETYQKRFLKLRVTINR